MKSDAQIVLSVLDGNRNQFKALVQRHGSSLFALALSETGDVHRAEDVLQDSFMKAYRNLHHLRRPDRFAGWIRSITVHTARSHQRRRNRQPLPLDPGYAPAGDPGGEPGQLTCKREKAERIHTALSRLPPAAREAMILHYLLDRTPEEIARRLQIDRNAVYARLSRGRQRLKKELIAMFKDELEELGTAARMHLEQVIPRIERTLQREEAHQRRKVARELRLLAARANHTLLASDLQDEDDSTRAEAARLAGETGDGRLTRPLLQRLDAESSPQVLEAVVSSLAALGCRKARGPIRELMRQTVDMNLHRACARSLRRLEQDQPEKVPPLTICDLRDAGLEDILLKMLDDEDTGVTVSALEGLARMESKRAKGPALEKLATDDRHPVRRMAAVFFRMTQPRSPEVLAALEAALHDQRREVIMEAARALAVIGNEGCLQALMAALKKEANQSFPPTMFHIGEAIASILHQVPERRGEVMESTLDLLSDPATTQAGIQLALLLRKIAAPVDSAPCARLLETIRREPRGIPLPHLLTALGRIADPAAASTLKEYLYYTRHNPQYADYVDQVRSSAAGGLAALGTEGQTHLLDAVRDEDCPLASRIRAVETLEQCGDDRSFSHLQEVAKTVSQPRIRNRIRLALKRRQLEER